MIYTYNMQSDEEETDLYEELLEPNRDVIVNAINPKGFYDQLRAKRVLNASNCEEIENKPIRIEKAGALLDILRTKGNNGVQKFLDVLEYEHPECFKKVTKKDPRDPPPGYHSHDYRRESYLINMIDKLPTVAKEMMQDYQEKKDLTIKLKEMTDLLQYAHNEKQNMEQENESLQRNLVEQKKKVSNLEKNLAISMRQQEKLKDEAMDYLKNSLQLTKEKDHYRERWQSIQMERDEQERRNEKLKEEYSNVRDELARTKRESAALVPRAIGVPDTSRDVAQAARPNFLPQKNLLEEGAITREQILREERDELREKCEELSEKLDVYRQESEEYQRKYLKERERTEKLRSAYANLDDMFKDKSEKITDYYKLILQLEQEKKAIEEETLKEQSKRKQESDKRQKLFKEKHDLEIKFEELKSEFERMKTMVRNSMSSLPEQDRRSGGSSDSDGDHERKRVHNIKTSKCEQCLLGYWKKNSQDSFIADDELSQDPFTEKFQEYRNIIFDCHPSGNATQMKCSTLPKTLEGGDPSVLRRAPQRLLSETNSDKDQPANPLFNVPRRPHIARSPTVDPQVGWSIKNPQNRVEEMSDPFRERVDTRLMHLVTQNEDIPERPRPCKRQELPPPPSSASETSDDSNHYEQLLDLNSYEVLSSQLPPHIIGLNEENLDSQCFTVVIATPVLGEKFEITGGNFTGIFVSKLYKTIAKLNVGDQILKLVCRNTDKMEDRISRNIKGYTLEDTRKLLDRPAGTELEILIKQAPLNYDLVQKWMKNNQSHGDYFFIRSHTKCDYSTTVPNGIAAHIGDIFRVTNTNPAENEMSWQAFKFSRCTGKWNTKPGFIPNEKEAKKFHHKRSFSQEEQHFHPRSGAFRCNMMAKKNDNNNNVK